MLESAGGYVLTDAVTVVLTSCARFDLLERGLRSFFEKNTYPIERFLLIEDSGDKTAREIAKAVDESIEVHVAAVRRGQSASIDYAYGCLLYTSPSPRDKRQSRMPSSA